MTITAVQEFLNNVSKDQALQTELSKALESDNDRAAVTSLARSKGYEFSSDELWAEVQKRQSEFSQKREAGEISDAELEDVAGGIAPAIGVALVTGGVALLNTALQEAKNIKW